MTCPVCKRELAPTLSICLTCGAMMHDTVREELETKISSPSGGLSASRLPVEPPRPNFIAAAKEADVKSEAPTEIEKPEPKPMTTELTRKHTSQTLVEFQPKHATLPDWRLQLQNAVRQRSGGETAASSPVAAPQPRPTTNGANALKMEIESVPAPRENANPRLESVIKRIEDSRRTFLPATQKKSASVPGHSENGVRKFPFEVVTPNGNSRPAVGISNDILSAPKPKLVSTIKIEKKAYDTNKLPPLERESPEPVKEPRKLGMIVDGQDLSGALFFDTTPETVPETETAIDENDALPAEAVEEFDDLAPFSMRFGAGLFDLILAGFGTLIILSPFMLSGGSWWTAFGIITVTASVGIFLFLYMTASLAVWGKTFGMRLFSLELIDADANVYPTVHQAAVSSAVYLLSMMFAGAGFLTVLFTEEKRALHDIVSGTLLIREI